MVQAADSRQRDHVPELPRLDRASDRRVAVEPHVRAALVVVGGVLADQVQELTLTKHDHVLEQLSTKGAYPPFRVVVLPRGFRRGAELFDTKVSDSRVEGPAVDCDAVANQADHVGIGADRLDDLLGGPRGIRVRPSR